jgi:hypothetical protein
MATNAKISRASTQPLERRQLSASAAFFCWAVCPGEEMEHDLEIERITNGFIVTKPDGKTYYPTMEKLFESLLSEKLKEIDTYYREHQTLGDKQHLRLVLKEID